MSAVYYLLPEFLTLRLSRRMGEVGPYYFWRQWGVSTLWRYAVMRSLGPPTASAKAILRIGLCAAERGYGGAGMMRRGAGIAYVGEHLEGMTSLVKISSSKSQTVVSLGSF